MSFENLRYTPDFIQTVVLFMPAAVIVIPEIIENLKIATIYPTRNFKEAHIDEKDRIHIPTGSTVEIESDQELLKIIDWRWRNRPNRYPGASLITSGGERQELTEKDNMVYVNGIGDIIYVKE